MATWPSTNSFPQDVLLAGFSEEAALNTIEFSTSTGPRKIRKRATARPRFINCVLRLESNAHVEQFEDFYINDTQYGVLPFTWKDHRTQLAQEYRFANTPTYNALSCNNWDVTLRLEALP